MSISAVYQQMIVPALAAVRAGASGIARAGVPTTAPGAAAGAQEMPVTFLACILAGALIVAWRLGVFRRASVCGPVRLGGEMSAAGAMFVAFIAFVVWMLMQVVYVAFVAQQFKQAHPKESFDTKLLTSSDFAFLSTVPFAFGLAALLIGDAALRRQTARRLGYSLRNFFPGLGKAIVAMLIVIPVMWTASVALQMFYDAIHYKHPAEHELLGAMKEAPDHVRTLLVIGAVVAAPVFEEMFFRGHLQSILLRLFSPSLPSVVKPIVPLALVVPATNASDTLPAPAIEAPPLIDSPVLEYQPAPPETRPAPPAPPSPLARWLAVLFTAFIFAIFHPLWMAPLIFVLAVCLGYAYERTGNLWVSIFIHAMFNASSTLIFLNM